MTVIDDLLTSAFSASQDYPVQEVLVGIHWTAIQSRFMGLAATHSDATCCYAEDIRGAGHLQECSAHELAKSLLSSRLLEACIGMAALNSFLPVNEDDLVELNARDLLIERGNGKNVVLVGHFAFLEDVRQTAGQLWVLELDPAAGDLPAIEAPRVLPMADVIGITASTLINHTFEDLEKHFPPHALVVMLGPSTPISRVLFDHHIDVLAGARVTEPTSILRAIGQGSPLHKPKGMRRLTIARKGLRALA